MHIYFKINRSKFNPNPIWNDEALGFLKSISQQEQEVQQEHDE